MKYALLIYSAESLEPSPADPAFGPHIEAYGKVTAAMEESQAKLGGEALKPISTATTVRMRDGKAQVTDGPFAETKEQLGGFYIIEAENLDAALEWAKQIPSGTFGSVEVRPVENYEDFA